jgi:hypothetical protein
MQNGTVKNKDPPASQAQTAESPGSVLAQDATLLLLLLTVMPSQPTAAPHVPAIANVPPWVMHWGRVHAWTLPHCM